MTHQNTVTAVNVANAEFVSPRKSRDFNNVARRSITELEVPVSMILEEEGFNARMDSLENAQHIDGIAKSIARNFEETGRIEHETVKVSPIVMDNGEQAFVTYDGHCTFKGILRAMSEYNVPVETIRIAPKELTLEERKMAILSTNRQKKLNIIERGKAYTEVMEANGWNQLKMAEWDNVTQAEVSQCIRAYNMPDSLKELVAQGFLSDRDALSKSRELEVKDDQETTASNIADFTAKIVETSHKQAIDGGEKRVRVNSQKGQKKAKVRHEALDILSAKVSEVSDGEGATFKLTAEEMAVLKNYLN